MADAGRAPGRCRDPRRCRLAGRGVGGQAQEGRRTTEAQIVATRDILAELGASDQRPRLLIGFAAETERVVEQAIAKQVAKQADWIVANDVSGDVMGGHRNRVHLVTADGVEDWPEGSKDEVARRLIERVAQALG